MKKCGYLVTWLGLLVSFLMVAPSVSAHAAAGWPSSSGYPAPPSFSDVTGLFEPTQKDSSLIIDSATGSAVGMEINKDAPNQSGAIWSTAPMFDLDKDASYTMYYYLGNKTTIGEGMAFVLAARPAAPKQIDPSSLGIWGVDHLPAGSTSQQIANTALPNSFALYVDTRRNGGDAAGGYDQYSAYTDYYFGAGYPGQANMYRISNPYWMSWLYFKGDPPFNGVQTGIGRQNTLASTAANGKWHQVKIDWKKDNRGGGTLTYTVTVQKSNGKPYVFSEKVTWTSADIQKYFAQNADDPVPRQLYLGFTGTTSNYYEPHVVAIGALPEVAKVKGTVALMRGAETVDANTHLKVEDAIHYDYVVDVQATMQAAWPTNGTITMDVPKGQYFDYLKADGTPAQPGDQLPITLTIGSRTVTVQGKVQSDGNRIVVTQMPSVAAGTAAKLQFSLPVRVKHHGLLKSTLFHDKPIGTVSGDGQTYDLKTPAGKDVLEYILDPETGDLTLEKVPSFIFELKDGAGGYRNPNVMDMVNGIPNPDTASPNQLETGQWLTNQHGLEPANSTGKVLSIKDTRPTKQGWHLMMQLTPFTLVGQPYVLGDHGSQQGGKATLVLADRTATGTDKVATIRDNNNATLVKNMAAGGTDWTLGAQTGNIAAYLGIEQTATAKAGQYQATATWLLSNAPQ